jgi:hypothetical protein
MSREHVKIKKRIREGLRDGPRTVPELSQATGISTDKVLWHLMSLRKYGEVTEVEEKDSYVSYALEPKPGEKP